MWLFLVVLVKEYLPPAVQVFQSLDPGNFYLRYESVNYLVVFLNFLSECSDKKLKHRSSTSKSSS